MAARLFLIRHGETEGDGRKCYKGTLDVPLSERGLLQAENAGRFVRELLGPGGRGLSALYSSGLVRALRSAEAVGRVFGLLPVTVPELRERDFGTWEGLSFDEIEERWPGEFRAWARDPLRFSPLGGESTLEVRDRVMPAVEALLGGHPESTICVVAHGGVNRIVLCHYLGIPLEHIFRIEQDFACVNLIEFHHGYPAVRLLNGVGTPPGEEDTALPQEDSPSSKTGSATQGRRHVR